MGTSAEDIMQLVIGYLPGVLTILLSVLLVVRRVGLPAVLMLVGSLLLLVISIGWRFLWSDLMEVDEFGSPNYSQVMIYQTFRTVASAVAQLLFGIGLFMLVVRHVKGGTPAPLEEGRLFEERGTALALANELDALYHGMVLHCVLMIVSLVGSLLFLFVMLASGEEDGAYLVGLLGVLASLVFGVLFTVKWCKLHYRHWRVAIEQTGFNEFTAEQAVGFLFIPLFNLYWIFRSYVTLSELLYKAGTQPKYGGRTPIINTDSTRTLCVINIFASVMYVIFYPVGALLGLVNIFIWFNVHAQHRRAVTHMLRAEPLSVPQP